MDLEAAAENLERLRSQETLRIVPTSAALMENRDEVVGALRELLDADRRVQ